MNAVTTSALTEPTDVTIAIRISAPPGELSRVAARLVGSLREVLGASLVVESAPVVERREDEAVRILADSRRVLLRGIELELTRLEFDLLLFLCDNPGRVHTRATLMAEVWQSSSTLGERTIDVHVQRVRRKLGSDVRLIRTVRGIGYRVDDPRLVRIERADQATVTAWRTTAS